MRTLKQVKFRNNLAFLLLRNCKNHAEANLVLSDWISRVYYSPVGKKSNYSSPWKRPKFLSAFSMGCCLRTPLKLLSSAIRTPSFFSFGIRDGQVSLVDFYSSGSIDEDVLILFHFDTFQTRYSVRKIKVVRVAYFD